MLSFRAACEEEMGFSKRFGLSGRSFCPNCKHSLSFLDLVPLLSFVLLLGKCRYCRKKISPFYPVMEALMGVSFVFAYVFWQSHLLSPIDLAFTVFVMSLLVGIFVADLFLGIIPDIFVAMGVGGTLFYNPFVRQNLFFGFLLAGFFSFLFFLVLYLITKTRGIGFGDVKFAFLIGLVLGPLGTFYALWFAFVSGALVSVFFILLRRKKIGDTIPLGPFLVLGVFLMLFWGKEIVGWFCGSVGICF